MNKICPKCNKEARKSKYKNQYLCNCIGDLFDINISLNSNKKRFGQVIEISNSRTILSTIYDKNENQKIFLEADDVERFDIKKNDFVEFDIKEIYAEYDKGKNHPYLVATNIKKLS